MGQGKVPGTARIASRRDSTHVANMARTVIVERGSVSVWWSCHGGS